MRLPERSAIALAIEADAVAGMPNFHYANTDQHGYMILDIQENRIQTDWFYVPILDKVDIETYGGSAVVNSNSPLVLVNSDGAASSKANAPDLAPFPAVLSVEEDGVLPMGVYPNPASHTTQISFAVNKSQKIKIDVIDINGKELGKVSDSLFPKGVQAIELNISNLNSGTYFAKIQTESSVELVPFKIVK